MLYSQEKTAGISCISAGENLTETVALLLPLWSTKFWARACLAPHSVDVSVVCMQQMWHVQNDFMGGKMQSDSAEIEGKDLLDFNSKKQV